MYDAPRSAGWYPDPSGRHEYRYWDGTSWTQEVADAGVATHEGPMPPAPPEPAVGQQPSRPRRGIAFLVAGVVLLAVGVVGFVVAAAVDDDYQEERDAVEAAGVDPDQAADDLQSAADAVDTGINDFYASTNAIIAAWNALLAASGCDPLSLSPCLAPAPETVEAEMVPAAADYSAAVDGELAALAALNEAVAALEEELG